MLKNILLVLLIGALIALWILIGSLNSRVEVLNNQNQTYSKQLDLQQAEIQKLRKENEGLNAKVKISSELFNVDGKLYPISKIALAVAKREGSTSCGIKINGAYVSLSREAGLRLCAAKLAVQINRYGFDQALRRWKTVPPFEPYISDIKSILREG